MRKTPKSIRSISKYLPILIIVLSITIMVGSTFAYFTDRKEDTSNLTFSKVELSSETTLGVDGAIHDVIPGSKLIDGEVAFSKAIDSEAIYVRAKVSFSLPSEYKNDTDMQGLLDKLRSATNFNIESGEQAGGAVWSEKQGNYFYLVTKDDATKLMRIDTIDTYVLSSDMVVPRDLESLEDNAQYMKSINFHIAFEAIQADNVSGNLADTKEVFDELFPSLAGEVDYSITYIGVNGFSSKVELNKDDVIVKPEVDANIVGNDVYFDGKFYADSEFTTEYVFGEKINGAVQIYVNTTPATEGLTYVENEGYCVVTGNTNELDDSVLIIPNYHNNLPVTEVGVGAFIQERMTSIIMPETITTIGRRAFAECDFLDVTSFYIPNSVEVIGNQAFYWEIDTGMMLEDLDILNVETFESGGYEFICLPIGSLDENAPVALCRICKYSMRDLNYGLTYPGENNYNDASANVNTAIASATCVDLTQCNREIKMIVSFDTALIKIKVTSVIICESVEYIADGVFIKDYSIVRVDNGDLVKNISARTDAGSLFANKITILLVSESIINTYGVSTFFTNNLTLSTDAYDEYGNAWVSGEKYYKYYNKTSSGSTFI